MAVSEPPTITTAGDHPFDGGAVAAGGAELAAGGGFGGGALALGAALASAGARLSRATLADAPGSTLTVREISWLGATAVRMCDPGGTYTDASSMGLPSTFTSFADGA